MLQFSLVLAHLQLVDNRIVLFDQVFPLLEAVQEIAHVEFQDSDQRACSSSTHLCLVRFHEFSPDAVLGNRESSSIHPSA